MAGGDSSVVDQGSANLDQCKTGVASVPMQTQVPCLNTQVSTKRSRRVYGLPPSTPFTFITPVAIATFPYTCTLNDSGATCCCCAPGAGADDFTLAKNSALVWTEPSSFTSTIPSSRIESSALVSPDLYA